MTRCVYYSNVLYIVHIIILYTWYIGISHLYRNRIYFLQKLVYVFDILPTNINK